MTGNRDRFGELIEDDEQNVANGLIDRGPLHEKTSSSGMQIPVMTSPGSRQSIRQHIADLRGILADSRRRREVDQ